MKCLRDYINLLGRVLVCLLVVFLGWLAESQNASAATLSDKPLTGKLGIYASTLTDNSSVSDKTATLKQYQKAKQMGFSYVRVPFRIDPELTPLSGSYNYDKMDYAIKLAKQVGLTPIVYFVSGSHNPEANTWQSLYPDMTYSTTLINIMKRVAVNTVKRYAGSNIVWEGWNEPNGYYWFNQDSAKTVKDWVSFDQTIATAVRTYTKNGIFLTGVFSGYSAKNNTIFVHARNNGLTQNASAVSNHPYQTGLPEELLSNDQAYSGVKMPTVTTEIGYTTKSSWQGKVSEDDQAKYDARSIFILDSMGQPLISMFNLQDSNDTGWGMYRQNGSEKKVAKYISYLLKNLKEYRFVKRIDMNHNKSTFALLYRKGNVDKVVYWATKNETLVPVQYQTNNKFLLVAQSFPQVMNLNSGISKHEFAKNSGKVIQNNVKLVDSSGKIIKVNAESYLPNTNVEIDKIIPNNYKNFNLFEYSSYYHSPSNNSVIIYQVYKVAKVVTSSKSTANAHLSALLIIIGLVILLTLIAIKSIRRKKS